jgi:hypothetical protein
MMRGGRRILVVCASTLSITTPARAGDLCSQVREALGYAKSEFKTIRGKQRGQNRFESGFTVDAVAPRCTINAPDEHPDAYSLDCIVLHRGCVGSRETYLRLAEELERCIGAVPGAQVKRRSAPVGLSAESERINISGLGTTPEGFDVSVRLSYNKDVLPSGRLVHCNG